MVTFCSAKDFIMVSINKGHWTQRQRTEIKVNVWIKYQTVKIDTMQLCRYSYCAV